jgi:uncharacterized caspase-like protein
MTVTRPNADGDPHALLIGNEAHGTEIGRLANPHNDVALHEQALKGLGFEVTVARDTSLGALTRAVNAYARRIQAAGPGTIAFFCYSGHGASVSRPVTDMCPVAEGQRIRRKSLPASADNPSSR